ncbi:speriolin isoform X4 [Sminthopsis crassicaudata]|uniref:speriolin isoform X4 n=1 Tax=Sminthopsis crassicaudata TaxID=9301 RepID=UPI003D68832B
MSPTSPGLRPRPPERCCSSSISTTVPPIMSLLSNYEGLRHQIERLVRENEELKKLVRLIRENHELKSAIKTQAGAMGISGISSMFNDGTAGSTLQTTDRSCPSAGPVSTNDPGLDELGLLNSLVDILNYSQSSSSTSPATSPTSSPISGPLPYPLNNTIPGSVAVLPNNPLINFLTGNLNNPLAGSIPASPNALPANPLQSSRACPSTNPVMDSGTVSTATGTLSDPQDNLLPKPRANNTLLIDPSRPHSPLDTGCHSPTASAAPSTTVPKAICQDTSNTAQRNILQPTPARNAIAAHATLSLPNPHPSPPPRSCTSSSSANNARGARSSEPPNKSLLEMERKMAHRKTLKVNETPRDPKQLTWERLVGEIAFQLDRRILSNIFPERVRLYGFTVSNIPEKIIQASLNTSNHKLDEELCQTLTQRYVSVMNRLQSLGYNGRVHPGLTEQLVNAYGILRERPELAASEGGCYTMDFLQRVVTETVPPSMLNDALLLLSCLNQLSQDDGKPMFIW